ncbi:MAG TPA: 4Fe-4S binding protein [Anaerolineaceae bacterium]
MARKQQGNYRKSRKDFDQVARKVVQIGFLLLFLYPLFPVIYKRLTYQPVGTLTSWLLPWDPLLFIGAVLKGSWGWLVIGAPLFLLVLTFVFGRVFCGWICPVGTLLDIVRSLAFWQRHRKIVRQRRISTRGNSRLRYYLLIGVVFGGIVSIQFLGLLDPLVIFQRFTTSLVTNWFAFQQPAPRVLLSAVSFILIGIVLLELWQPRFWCRNLCPLGALLSLVSRFSLLKRVVSQTCTNCGECRIDCPMGAIPRNARETRYADCTFCLECQPACPRKGINFRLGHQSSRQDSGEVPLEKIGGTSQSGEYQAGVTRRDVLGGVTAGVLGMAAAPLLDLAGQRKIIRPPGALPEDEFLRTCIVCQECVRVCPTGGLRPTLFEGGLIAIGTPQLIPRQGGCSLNPSCPNLCAKVCPVGAILPTAPADLKLGLAVVDHSLCLAWDQGVKCLVCVEACLNHAALAYQGRVVVDPNKCSGCGRCENGCPVPGSAIRVQPL